MDLIRDFLARGIEVIPDGSVLRVRGQLTDKDRALIRQNKEKILEALSQNGCLGCKASGHWDYSNYAGKLLCFYYVVYECKPGRPVPCEMARNDCPLIKQVGEK